MTTEARPLTEVTEEALGLLNERLGVTNTMRFLGQFTLGHGNYTEERKALFADLTLGEITSRIRQMRPKQTAEQDDGEGLGSAGTPPSPSS